MNEQLGPEKRRRVEKDAVEENEDDSENIHDYDFEEVSPLTNSVQSDILSSSSSVATPPVYSSSKLGKPPRSSNHSEASSRSDYSNDPSEASSTPTILLEDYIDSKHLDIGLFHHIIISEIVLNSSFCQVLNRSISYETLANVSAISIK
jgi:hypothetical protein